MYYYRTLGSTIAAIIVGLIAGLALGAIFGALYELIFYFVWTVIWTWLAGIIGFWIFDAAAGLFVGGIIGLFVGAFIGLFSKPERWQSASYATMGALIGASMAWAAFANYGIRLNDTLNVATGAFLGAVAGAITGIIMGAVMGTTAKKNVISAAIGTVVIYVIYGTYVLPYFTFSLGGDFGIILGVLGGILSGYTAVAGSLGDWISAT